MPKLSTGREQMTKPRTIKEIEKDLEGFTRDSSRI
jgi:hypothetical protein